MNTNNIARYAGAILTHYIFRRFLLFILVVWLASTVIFLIPRLSGQDPVKEKLLLEAQRGGHMQAGLEEMAASYQKRLGLDKPLWTQYTNFLFDIMRFDLGPSIAFFPRSVNSILKDSMMWSLGLLGIATIISFAVGTLAGALLAWPRSPRALHFLFMPFLTLSAIPYYLLGLLLVYVFAFKLQWLPLFGGYGVGTIPNWSDFGFLLEVGEHGLLPGLSIVMSAIGFWALGMRGMMVTTQGEDFMIQADAKGLNPTRIFYRYAVRNAILPQTTGLALSLGRVFIGSVLVEVIFRYPGLGNTLYQAIRLSDYFVIRGIIFMVILALALATFVMDVTYPLLDPRVSYKKAA